MRNQGTKITRNLTLKANGKKLALLTPAVMGILNLSQDSFYKKSRVNSHEKLLKKADKMIRHGADILDLGAAS